MGKKKWKSDRIIGISAMLISLMTLFIFIYQTKIIQQQSRLSVTPRIGFHNKMYSENEDIYIVGSIMNKGIGPAIIDSIKIVTKKGKKVNFDLDRYFEEFGFNSDLISVEDYSVISSGSTISANETFTLFRLKSSFTDMDSLYQELGLGENDNLVQIEVLYSSIYQEKWKVSNVGNGNPKKIR